MFLVPLMTIVGHVHIGWLQIRIELIKAVFQTNKPQLVLHWYWKNTLNVANIFQGQHYGDLCIVICAGHKVQNGNTSTIGFHRLKNAV